MSRSWRQAVFVLRGDLVDQAEDGRLDELDQALEHLRLAREVAVQRRFRDLQPAASAAVGDAIAARLLQHRSQRLEDLQASFAGLRSGWLRRAGVV